ncbi:hypothetical protein M9Y10_031618 [Tritrichomonas musculus]|uniref:Surface antigen BspA-like n=1 Tax=Tritrichomonas musculus TaxID=1915356 RepID=A0ABR2H140_9EUKA
MSSSQKVSQQEDEKEEQSHQDEKEEQGAIQAQQLDVNDIDNEHAESSQQNGDVESNDDKIQHKETEHEKNSITQVNDEQPPKVEVVEIEEDRTDFEEPKKKGVQNENSSFFKSFNDLEKFNKMNGENQLSLIKQMQSNMSKQVYDKVVNLLAYLMNETEQDKTELPLIYVLPSIQADEDENEADPIIGICHKTTEKLFEKDVLNGSSQLNKHIDNFSQIFIEISHPSPHFKDVYKNVLEMRNDNHKSNLKIAIFVTATETTSQFFRENSEINSVSFDSCVKEISSVGYSGSFEGCTSLSRVRIPSTITSIGACSFSGCLSLVSVNIPESVTTIGDFCFGDCRSLLDVSIPMSVVSLGSNCFKGCTSLFSVDIEASLSVIKYATFCDCHSLSSIVIPRSTRVIESEAFARCSSLKKVDIPASVNEIEYDAFNGCSSLSCVTIPASVQSIGCAVFMGCTKLGGIEIPESVKVIQHHCFAGCKSLKNVAIHSSVESVGYNAFDGCSSLREIEIPLSVKSIGFNAFANCPSLVKISLPSAINTYPIGIGPNAEVIRI